MAPFVVLIIGLILDPHRFWDEFLYRYFWGPVVADKEGHPVNGISEGYNPISTICYALLLGLGFVLTYKILRRLEIEIDTIFVLACIPIFLYGGTSRALEDTSLFQGNVGFLFISPLIYFLIIGLFLLLLAAGWVLRESSATKIQRTAGFAALALFIAFLYFLFTGLYPGEYSFILDPLLVLLFAGISVLLFYLTEERIGTVASTLFAIGMLLLLVSISYLISFSNLPAWQAIFFLENGVPVRPHPLEILIIPGVAAALTFAIWIISKAAKIAVLLVPINLILFFAQFLDGAATYRGMELYGYSEKHVLPSFFISLFGTALVMLLFKFILVLAVIVLLDILFKDELKPYPGLTMLMKFVVVFLGLAPGTRDAVRIALGV